VVGLSSGNSSSSLDYKYRNRRGGDRVIFSVDTTGRFLSRGSDFRSLSPRPPEINSVLVFYTFSGWS